MHGMIRAYTGEGAKRLATRVEERKTEIEQLMRTVPGLITWGLMRTPDGGVTFTLCKDQKGCEESSRIVREWVQQHASDIGAPAPTITEGPVTMRVSA